MAIGERGIPGGGKAEEGSDVELDFILLLGNQHCGNEPAKPGVV